MRLAIAATLLLLTGPAWAGQAVCREYTQAVGEDRSLFNGFVYGFVTARMQGKSDTLINQVTKTVADMTEKYCTKRPDDRVQAVVAGFTDVVMKIGFEN